MGQRGFSGHLYVVEKSGRASTETSRLRVPSLMKENYRLIQVDHSGPNKVFFGLKSSPGIPKLLQGLSGLALPAKSNRLVHKRFGCFISRI